MSSIGSKWENQSCCCSRSFASIAKEKANKGEREKKEKIESKGKKAEKKRLLPFTIYVNLKKENDCLSKSIYTTFSLLFCLSFLFSFSADMAERRGEEEEYVHTYDLNQLLTGTISIF